MSELYELGRALRGVRGMDDLLKGLAGPVEEQVGSALVGAAQNNAYGKALQVTFPKPFAAVPVVLATAVWGSDITNLDEPDTFTVTITQVTTVGFRVNVYRVDPLLSWTLASPKPRQGWNQQLRLNWFARTTGENHE